MTTAVGRRKAKRSPAAAGGAPLRNIRLFSTEPSPSRQAKDPGAPSGPAQSRHGREHVLQLALHGPLVGRGSAAGLGWLHLAQRSSRGSIERDSWQARRTVAGLSSPVEAAAHIGCSSAPGRPPGLWQARQPGRRLRRPRGWQRPASVHTLATPTARPTCEPGGQCRSGGDYRWSLDHPEPATNGFRNEATHTTGRWAYRSVT